MQAPALLPDSEVILRGMTSVGEWASKSNDIRSLMALDFGSRTPDSLFDRLAAGARPAQPIRLPLNVQAPSKLELLVPVRSMKGSSDAMDRDMYAALKAREHPAIHYVLDQIQRIEPALDPAHPGLRVWTVGELTVAGVRRLTTIEATVRREPGGRFVVHASARLRMTDFGVTPPSALFGLIRAEDAMTVVFDLDFSSPARSGAAPPATQPGR